MLNHIAVELVEAHDDFSQGRKAVEEPGRALNSDIYVLRFSCVHFGELAIVLFPVFRVVSGARRLASLSYAKASGTLGRRQVENGAISPLGPGPSKLELVVLLHNRKHFVRPIVNFGLHGDQTELDAADWQEQETFGLWVFPKLARRYVDSHAVETVEGLDVGSVGRHDEVRPIGLVDLPENSGRFYFRHYF